MMVLRGISPFDPGPRVATFGDWQASTIALIERGFFYGTAIWLMCRAGMNLVRSVALVATVLAAIEILQALLRGRNPDVTDPILAIFMGLILAAVSRPTLIPSPETEKQFRSAG
jgi:hypothetical protein